MFDRIAAHRPPTIRNLSTRTRRFSIGAAAVTPALLASLAAVGLVGVNASSALASARVVMRGCRS